MTVSSSTPSSAVRSAARPPVRWRRSLAASAISVMLVGGVGAAGASAAHAAPAARSAASWSALTAPAAAPSRTADTGARITRAQTGQGGRVDLTIESPSLGKSVGTRVVLPVGWSEGSAKRYPVVYAYHGGQNDALNSWPKETDIETWARRHELILVMPEAENGAYLNWHNYGKFGTPKWEDFHTVEVTQLIERNYGGSAVRAAIGNSSGGYGAFAYAARNPGLFTYAASLSGTLYLREGAMPALLMFINATNFQDPYAMYGIPWADDEHWKSIDPAFLADRLRGTELFFSSGTTGEPGPGDPDVAPWDIGLLSEIAVGHNNKEFKKILDAKGIPHVAHIYDAGRHDWAAWRREAAFVWPLLVKAIGARPA